MVSENVFTAYPTDATWEGLDKVVMHEESNVQLLVRLWTKFGKFLCKYNAWYRALGVINKDQLERFK